MCFTNTSTIEIGLSEFNAMIITVLKGNFVKIVRHRNYSKFNAEKFRKDLEHELLNLNVEPNYSSFSNVVEKLLNVHAPLKRKMLEQMMDFS